MTDAPTKRVRADDDPWKNTPDGARARPALRTTVAPETRDTLEGLAERTGLAMGVLIDQAVELLAEKMGDDDDGG